ncbi:MAG: flagellar hook-associated protein FlgK [Pseudomonadota bacterium]
MTLTNAIRTANSSLASHSQQISNISRNISGIGDPTYVRRDSSIHTALFGSTRVETQRYVNQSILTATIGSGADAEYSAVVASGLDRIATLQSKGNFAFSPAKLVGDLQKMTEFAAAAPSDGAALTSLIESARTMASALNSSYDEILTMKEDADKQIQQSVNTINSLLAEIKEVNDTIVNATKVGKEAFDSLDVRDQLVDKLSREIGIKVVPGENNDIILTTNGGALLFEGNPRSVTFQQTPSYGPLSTGGELRVDGVTVTGPNALLGADSGKIAGHFEMRDSVLTGQQNQLDEVARGLVELFSETDQTGGGKPPLAGLFTWAGGPAVPASGALESGIASTIRLNPLVDPQLGGDPAFIRDGALNGDADYLYNTDGGVSFSDRLYNLAAAFDVGTTFDTAAGLTASQSLNGFVASSADSLNAQRASALTDYEYRTELATQFKQSLQSESGPNLDYEMSRLLEVERAYQASAQLLKAVDEMFDVLLSTAA